MHYSSDCANINKLSGESINAPLAQLDRASGYGPEGQGFESLTACHEKACNLNGYRLSAFYSHSSKITIWRTFSAQAPPPAAFLSWSAAGGYFLQAETAELFADHGHPGRYPLGDKLTQQLLSDLHDIDCVWM